MMRYLSVALPFSLFALAACSPPTVDPKGVEANIKTEVEKQNAGAKVKSVECPKTLTPKKDGTFDCTITYEDGGTQPAHMTWSDDNGSYKLSVKAGEGKPAGGGSAAPASTGTGDAPAPSGTATADGE